MPLFSNIGDNEIMKILMASSEVVPFSKSGGLADVVGALSEEFSKLGHEVRVFMPLYSFIDKTGFKKTNSFLVPMLGKNERVEIYEKELNGVIYAGLSHPYFSERKGIYGDTSFTPYPDNAPRFIFFSKALPIYIKASLFMPDVVHTHDWTVGLVPYFLDKFKIKAKTVFTIHNLAYQGVYPSLDGAVSGDILPEEAFIYEGNKRLINMMASGIRLSEKVTTVSKTYAKEILTKEYGCNLESFLKAKGNNLYGIINGIDTSDWNPESDKNLSSNYSINNLEGKKECKRALQKEFNLPISEDTPLISIISRLAEQKGFDDLLLKGEKSALEQILEEGNVAFAVIGTGDSRYVEALTRLQRKYPEKLSVKITFSNSLAHQAEAGADFFLMPSKYEPCGLNQLYSLRYGTLPIVNKTGGLEDSVIDISNENGNGIVLSPLSSENIVDAVRRALVLYGNKEKLFNAIQRAMNGDYTWTQSAKEYLKIYNN